VVSIDRDPCTPTVAYSNSEGGQNAYEINENGALDWDEGNIDADPRFIDAGAGDFRLAEDSPCIDAADPEAPNDPDDSPSDMGALSYVHAPPVEQLAIPLHRGWGLVGSPVIAPDPLMTTIWREQVEAGGLAFVKDMDGRFYAPASNFNNIPGWIPWQGYAYKMEQDGVLNVEGLTIDDDFPIPLRRGWSIISYQLAEPTLIQDAFGGIAENIILVKDEAGRFFNPRYGYDNIVMVSRGKGYKVLVNQASELVWGRGQAAAIPSLIEVPVQRMAPIAPPMITDRNMSVLVRIQGNWQMGESANGIPIAASNGSDVVELAAFTPAGLCIAYGSAIISEGEDLVGFAVWGDDLTTENIDGCHEGEKLVIRAWCDGVEFQTSFTCIDGEAVYSTDGFAYGELTIANALPVEFSLAKPYPNPFNSTVVISYALPRESAVEFIVTDVSGREQLHWKKDVVAAGRHRFDWNGTAISTGIYFVTMRAGEFKRTEKLLLVK